MTTGLLTGVRRTSLSDSVYETLLESIVSGRLAPGEQLSAVALAEQLQVSRTPVTEALRRLIHDGLVEHVNNHTVRVTRFDRNDVIEVYQMREALEGLAAQQAAEQMPDSAIQQLRERANTLLAGKGKPGWCARAIDFDLKFHDVLAAGAGNARLRVDIARYRNLVRGFCRMTGSEANLEAALAEHIAILDAIESRDAERARSAMQEHIRARLESVLVEAYPVSE